MKYVVACLVIGVMSGCQDARVVPDGAGNRPGQWTQADANSQSLDSQKKAAATTEEGPAQKDDEITANIRQQLMKSDMAVNVEGIKIVTQDGKVVLRGVVKTAEEKQKVEDVAHDVAGSSNVENMLEVE